MWLLTLLNAFSADVLGRIRAVAFRNLVNLIDHDDPYGAEGRVVR